MRPDILLAIDTSAAHCAAALLFGHREAGLSEAIRVVTRCEVMAKGQAERLPVLVAELLADEGLAWADLTQLAVGVGPGNFTGIRIAVAFVRGLALGLGIAAKGVTTFEAVAFAGGQSFPFWTLIDAPRGEIYAQRFPDGAAKIISADDAAALDAPIVHRNGIEGEALVAAIAAVAYRTPDQPNNRPAPFYLRAADATPPSDPPPVILDLGTL